jgi:hypothetical protein
VRADREPDVLECVKDAIGETWTRRDHLHFRKLRSDGQRMVLCKHIADLQLCCFVMASNRKNMRRRSNSFATRRAVTLVGGLPNSNWFMV